MPRTAIKVDKKELQKAIKEAEKSGPKSTQQELWQEVAQIYAKNTGQTISSGVVYLRVREWKLPVKTQKARKRGVKSGGKKTSRGDKFKKNSKIQKSITSIKKEFPNQSTLTKKIEEGSLASAVKLNCICCVGKENYAKRIRNCPCLACPMWPFRPYQGK